MSLGLVFSSKESDWKSCTRIVANILESYRLFLKDSDFKVYNFSNENEEYQNFKLATKLQSDGVSELIFIDHNPQPLELIKYLSNLDIKLDKVTFHIFGDFTLFIKDWSATFSILKGVPIVLVVASKKQQALITSLVSSDATVVVCPFPLKTDHFFFDENLRINERGAREISDDENLFIYTGRISFAKYSHKLLEIYANACKMTNRNSRLIFAGSFDDIVNPVLGKYFQDGFYQQKFLETLRKLPEDIQKRIEFHPGLNDQELLSLYNAADVFLGPSLYNDEDYGMSPIEALFCGCDAVLTDWGGYHSFKLEGTDTTTLVETSMTKMGVKYSHIGFVKGILKHMHAVKSSTIRSKSSSQYQSEFSIQSCSEKLKKIKTGFAGSSCQLSKLGQDISKSDTPFISNSGGASIHYFEVYKNYVS